MSPSSRGPITRLGRALGLLIGGRAAARAASSPAPPPPPPGEVPEVDPNEREVPSNRQAETVVALLLILGALCAFAFVALFIITEYNTQLLGLSLGLAFLMLAAAAIIAGKLVVPQETLVEERDLLLEEEKVEQVVELIESGGEGLSRRGLLVGAGGLAGAGMVTALAAPVASLGPTLNDIHHTQWHRGRRLVDEEGNPFLASEVQIGTFYTALPEHGEDEAIDAGLLMVKLPAEYLHLPEARQGWAPQGIVAYSKICPHAACAISLYRYPTYAPDVNNAPPAFTCPCHYSTFLPGEGGRLIFGPAGRSLPQLPLMVDDAGYVAAAGPFHEDVGPSWWNVHRGES
jgi:ubiquinol-cytochrome c reductase iron-sulfur subunit